MTSTNDQPPSNDSTLSFDDDTDLRKLIRPESERYELAFRWKHDHPEYSLNKTALRYGLPISTFKHRYNGRQSAQSYSESRQRLTPIEEQVLVRWTEKLCAWG
jgi:hypothetical protein